MAWIFLISAQCHLYLQKPSGLCTFLAGGLCFLRRSRGIALGAREISALPLEHTCGAKAAEIVSVCISKKENIDPAEWLAGKPDCLFAHQVAGRRRLRRCGRGGSGRRTAPCAAGQWSPAGLPAAALPWREFQPALACLSISVVQGCMQHREGLQQHCLCKEVVDQGRALVMCSQNDSLDNMQQRNETGSV